MSMPWPNSSRSCGAIRKTRLRCMALARRRSSWAVIGPRKVTCSSAVRGDPQNTQAAQSLKIASLVLQADPFAPRISDAERNERVRSGVSGCRRTAGRLRQKQTEIDLSPQFALRLACLP